MGRPEDMAFITPARCQLLRGAPAHLASVVVTLFLVTDLTIGGTVLRWMNEMQWVYLVVGAHGSRESPKAK